MCLRFLTYCTGDKTDLIWIHIYEQTPTKMPSYVELTNVNTTECLRACIDGKMLAGCSSVFYMTSNETCWLMAATRYSGGLELKRYAKSGKEYWELYTRGESQTLV